MCDTLAHMSTIEKDTEVTLHGYQVTKGTKLSFKGVTGSFTFISLDTSSTGTQWITCFGGRGGVAMFRSFRVDDLKTVHLDG